MVTPILIQPVVIMFIYLPLVAETRRFCAAVTQNCVVDVNQIFNGVFMKVNKATVNMLHRVEPYVTYG